MRTCVRMLSPQILALFPEVQGGDGLDGQLNAEGGRLRFIGPESKRKIAALFPVLIKLYYSYFQ